MNATIADVILGILSVIAAPFVIQGVHRAKTFLARLVQALLGVGLVLIFLFVWGSTGHDPLQLGYCWFARSAKPCQDIIWARSSVISNDLSNVEDPSNTTSDVGSVEIGNNQVESTQNLSPIIQSEVEPTSVAATAVKIRRPGELAEEWLRGGLYGSDNYMAALRKVTITSSGIGTYKAHILNQSDWLCDLFANANGDPGELRNCVSSEADTYSDRKSIPLRCNTQKGERVCAGDFSLDTTIHYTDSTTDEAKTDVSKWPGTFTIARH